MQTIFHRAQLQGLIERHPEASIEASDLDSQFVSRHYLMRQGKRTKRYRDWTKLTIVCHNSSHLIAGAVVSVAPCNDSPDLPPAAGKQSVACRSINCWPIQLTIANGTINSVVKYLVSARRSYRSMIAAAKGLLLRPHIDGR